MIDLAKDLGIDVQSDAYRAARRQARERLERAVPDRSCPNGCVNYRDPGSGEVVYGYGTAGCEFCNGPEAS